MLLDGGSGESDRKSNPHFVRITNLAFGPIFEVLWNSSIENTSSFDEVFSMVQLSGHNSKNYQAILRAKKRLVDDSKLGPASIVPENPGKSKRAVDEFGELAVRQLQQKQKHFTDEEAVILAEEYQNGKTLLDLAKQYGCHRDTVSKTLKKHGVKVRGRGVRPPQ